MRLLHPLPATTLSLRRLLCQHHEPLPTPPPLSVTPAPLPSSSPPHLNLLYFLISGDSHPLRPRLQPPLAISCPLSRLFHHRQQLTLSLSPPQLPVRPIPFSAIIPSYPHLLLGLLHPPSSPSAPLLISPSLPSPEHDSYCSRSLLATPASLAAIIPSSHPPFSPSPFTAPTPPLLLSPFAGIQPLLLTITVIPCRHQPCFSSPFSPLPAPFATPAPPLLLSPFAGTPQQPQPFCCQQPLLSSSTSSPSPVPFASSNPPLFSPSLEHHNFDHLTFSL